MPLKTTTRYCILFKFYANLLGLIEYNIVTHSFNESPAFSAEFLNDNVQMKKTKRSTFWAEESDRELYHEIQNLFFLVAFPSSISEKCPGAIQEPWTRFTTAENWCVFVTFFRYKHLREWFTTHSFDEHNGWSFSLIDIHTRKYFFNDMKPGKIGKDCLW